MRAVTIALTLALALTTAPLMAKGSGGHGGGGHASGGHAASSGGGHVATGHATARSAGGVATARASGAPSGVAATGRARNGQPTVGTAVPRTPSTPGASGFMRTPTTSVPLFVTPYLVRPNFLGFGFGGLGSFYVPYGSWYDDPFYSSYGSPYYGSPYYGSPYNSSPYYSSPFGYPYGAGGAVVGGSVGGGALSPLAPVPFSFDDDETGKLRLQIDQRDASVYVDGYYAGIVDAFDGRFQHLDLTPGPHHIKVEQNGYATLEFDVDIVAHKTIDYRAAMTPAVPAQ